MKKRNWKCFIGLHSWEAPFRYVYGPYTHRRKPLSEGDSYSGDGHMESRKERLIMQAGQARCSQCLKFKLPVEATK